MVGERVKLVIVPPVTLKFVEPGFGFLWFVALWPPFVLSQTGWLVCLIWLALRPLEAVLPGDGFRARLTRQPGPRK